MRLGFCVVVSVTALAAAGCSGKVEGGPAAPVQDSGVPDGGPQNDCTSARTMFAQEVWTPVFDAICLQCHSPDGVATAQNAMLQLLPSSYPGFLDANFENVSLVARYAFDEKSILLRKPLGEMAHGGGMRFTEDSAEYAALARLVEAIEKDEACDDTESTPALDDVELLGPSATFRKATIQLAGRLPTERERERLQEDGEAALTPLLDDLLAERGFLARLKDVYNDVLLTDLYLAYNGFAVDLLNQEQYPRALDEVYDVLDEGLRLRINRAAAREPLELIAHVVANDRPFSEILTADYTMINPYSAMLYESDAAFDNALDENEFVEAHVTITGADGSERIPHAGVLTSPMFLNRFPTTPTNRSRHRARKVYELFLATDILQVAERPIDPTASGRFNNPTRDDSQCNGCHRQIDPIAGAFLKWQEYDQERYEPRSDWHPEMFAPGFGKEVMDTAEYPRAEQWLAQRIVADPRFVLSALQTVYRGIIGREPLEYPADPQAPDFTAQLRAWRAQDTTFRAIGTAFVAHHMNMKTLVRELVLSPYFRAANVAEGASDERLAELWGMGTGRLSIPSVLARKIEAVIGFPWTRGWDGNDLLTTDYNVLYGGIDSNTVTDRLTQPSGVIANVAMRMANEVACESTARDFHLPVDRRLLFPRVEVADQPESENGDAIPAAVERIRETIQHLHAHVLGEELASDDPELERTYQLFYETWKEGKGKIAGETVNRWLPWQCQARLDPDTGEELPEDQRLSQDEGYTIRAWSAVLTYLLSDYGFLYE
jgi:hypothetical protein